MVEVARGKIGDRPWGSTLAALFRRRHTGTLTLFAAEQAAPFEIGIWEGAIVGAVSPMPADTAPRIAQALELVGDAVALGALIGVGGGDPRDEVDLVAELAGLSDEHAETLRAEVLVRRVARTFSIADGDFVVTDDPPRGDARTIVPIPAAIYQGVLTRMPDKRLVDELALFATRFGLPAPIDTEVYGFGTGELVPLLLAMQQNTSLAELELRFVSLGTRRVQAAVYTLLACGALVPIEVPAVGAAVADALVSRTNTLRVSVRAPTVPPGAAMSSPVASPGRTPTSPPGRPPTAPPGAAIASPVRTPTLAPATAHGSGSVAVRPPTLPPPGTGPVATLAASVSVRTPTSPPPPTRAATGTGETVPLPPRTATGEQLTAATAMLPRTVTGEPIETRTTTTDRDLAVLSAEARAQVQAAARAEARAAIPPTPAGSPPVRPSAPRISPRTLTPDALLARTLTPRPGGTQPPPEIAKAAAAAATLAFENGSRLLAEGKFADAVSQLNRAVALASERLDYAATLAWARFQAAEDKHVAAADARKLLGVICARSTTMTLARFYLGRVERALGREREALSHFRTVLSMQPSHVEAAAEVKALEAKLPLRPRRFP